MAHGLKLPRGMWDLPRPGFKPVSPPLAGGFLTTAPPGKSKEEFLKEGRGTSLAVQWLRLRASTAGGVGSIPGRGTKIPHTAQPKIKEGRS